MFQLSQHIGIDLGTANVLVYIRGRGVVLQEPSVVALDADSQRVLAVGQEARRMIGRTPGNIVATRPLREGVIANYDVTEKMLKYFVQKASGRRRLFKPQIMVCVPSGVTSVEKRAVREAAERAGARQCYLIEEPLAAALGAGLDISKAQGHFVVDIGGGTTDVAVLSLGGIVASESVRVGGDKLDEAIARFVKSRHNMIIGERTAEEIKTTVGTARKGVRQDAIDVRGRDLVTGLPRTLTMTADDTYEAMEEPIRQIIGVVKTLLERTPPELAADIMDHGIVLTGGGALLRDLDSLLARETGVAVHLPENALGCVAVGTGKALDSLEYLRGVIS